MADFLIDKLLPVGEIHLIGGPSGSGKTTWALQTFVQQWQHGKEVLGFKSFPVPWLYVSSDRSRKSVKATLERMEIPEGELRFVSSVDTGCHNMEAVLKLANALTPPAKFIYIDGLLNLLPDKVHPNDNKSVGKWLSEQTRMCDQTGITLLGSLHSPKMKKDEWYDNPRQRIAGGASWAGFSDTIILVEPVSPDDPSQSHHRRLLICPRNYTEVMRNLAFNEKGRLVEVDEVLYDDLMYAFLISLKPGATFHIDRLQAIFEGSASPRTLTRLVAKYVENGAIEQVSKGLYRKIAEGYSPSA